MKLAFVVQRYGIEVNGGAELMCRWLAELLAQNHEVTVLTTCAKGYVTWKNEYPEGVTRSNGVTIRRFAVDSPRDNVEFDEFSRWIYSHPHTREDEIHWMRLQGPYSSSLLEFLGESRDHFDLFIFFTYLYATTYFGLPIVADKAWLVPTAHDEVPIRLSLFHDVFAWPQLLLFNTLEEQQFVEWLFPDLRKPSEIVGIGINVPEDVSPKRFLAKLGSRQLGDHVLLYVGRVDPAKGCGELFNYFLRYKREHGLSLSLVVVGKLLVPIPPDPAIVPLGFVSESDKFDAIAAATLLVNPSRFESLSMLVLESWMLQKPALVNGNCLVLEGQCRRSNAGLWYKNYEEFAEALSCLLENPGLRDRLGRNGKKFVEDNYSWPIIAKKYERLFQAYAPQAPSSTDQKPRTLSPLHPRRRIYILVRNCVPNDAVSNDAVIQCAVLRAAGYDVCLYANHAAPDVAQFVRGVDRLPPPTQCKPDDILLYHYSVGWEKGTKAFQDFGGIRILKYHNVTPPQFFRPYSTDFTSDCAAGRRDLQVLATSPGVWVFADSKFNASELLARGAREERTFVLSPFHQIRELQQNPSHEKKRQSFQDGQVNLLFVGRVAPNKGHRELIRTLAAYSARNPRVQLLLAGFLDPRLQAYRAELDELIRRLGLDGKVRFLGRVDQRELAALYENAHVFVCTSEHEGFCVPVLEAMAFHVPVVACGNTAVRETVEGVGIWWPRCDPMAMAESIDLCVTNPMVAKRIKDAEFQLYKSTYCNEALEEKFLAQIRRILIQ